MLSSRGEVRADYLLPAPDVTESEAGPEFTVAALDALVRMKLTSFRLKDKVHLLDLLDVGLIDESWCDRFPPELGARLRELIESHGTGAVTFIEPKAEPDREWRSGFGMNVEAYRRHSCRVNSTVTRRAKKRFDLADGSGQIRGAGWCRAGSGRKGTIRLCRKSPLVRNETGGAKTAELLIELWRHHSD